MTKPGNQTLSHVDEHGQPRMVDVSDKVATTRTARARACVEMPAGVARRFSGGDLVTKKGSVVHTAIIAGTMAVKKTSELIPFCHPLAIEGCDFSTALDDEGRLLIDCEVRISGKTGVEMEALTGATVAALTVYDMLKALGHDMRIAAVELLFKSGGKSDLDRPAQT